MKNIFLACMLVVLNASATRASDSTSVQLVFSQSRINSNEVRLSIKAVIASGIKLYGLQKSVKDPVYSAISFDSPAKRFLVDSITEKGKAESEMDHTVD